MKTDSGPFGIPDFSLNDSLVAAGVGIIQPRTAARRACRRSVRAISRGARIICS